MESENDEIITQKYEGVTLSEDEQRMQVFLEKTYGLGRDEFISIILWLDNFSLKFDSVERFEQVEDALNKNFGLTSNDIYGILFSHGDVFCKDYSKTQEDFEFLNARYNLSKKDFAEMLKVGCVIDPRQARFYEQGLRDVFAGKKWIPMSKILKNTIEYANVDYAKDTIYKIQLLEKFGVSLEDIGGRFEFLKIPTVEFATRLKLMNLTNELPHSFLNVGHKTSNASVYKLFLKFQADNEFKQNGYKTKGNYPALKKLAETFDASQPLSEENIADINEKFAQKFKKLDIAISAIKMPDLLTKPAEQQAEVVADNASILMVEPQPKKVAEEQKAAPVVDAVENGKQISYVKNDSYPVKKVASQQSFASDGKTEFVAIDPSHKFIWTYMVKNFGLTYQEYPDVVRKINPDKRNRLQQQADDIEAVFEDVKKDFRISRKDFGQFFKYTLYGMEQRLALLECFGVTPQELISNNYVNAPILGLHYDQLEYMLKVASIGNVDLDRNLGRIAKFNRDTFLAKYIKFVESGESQSMMDTLLTEKDYQDIILKKVPEYRKKGIVEKKYAEMFPVSDSFLKGYNEHQRNLLMIVGLLVKKYGMSYADAKQTVQESKENFNVHSKLIEERIKGLNEIGYDSMNVIHNSGILKLPESKATPRALIAKYLGVDEETFLKRYLSTSESRVFARMMGAIDLKPSYYYASEKVFSGLTGFSTEELMKQHVINTDALYRLKKKIYETEKLKHIDAMLETTPKTPVLDENGKITAYTPQEVELRDYMLKKYGIDVFTFHSARYILGAQKLNFLTAGQAAKAIEILKSDFKMTDEDIPALFKNTPRAFSSDFKSVVSRYGYFEDNFSASRYAYKKLLLQADDAIVMKDGLAEAYAELVSSVKGEFGVEITKQDFLNILRMIKNDDKLNVVSYVHDSFSLLKNYNIDPSEIKYRYDFMATDGLRTLETRLMLSRLLDEKPNDYFGSGCFINPNLLAARYLLYKQGKIAKETLLMKKADFERVTGIQLEIPERLTSLERIEITKDVTKQAKSVSFALRPEMYLSKLNKKDADEIIIRNNDYLTYMLAEVLGVDFKVASVARSRQVRISDVYARFMAREDLQDKPEQYYLDEYSWQNLTQLPTKTLTKEFPATEEVVDMIIDYYLQLHPEDAFARKRAGSQTQKEQPVAQTEKIAD